MHTVRHLQFLLLSLLLVSTSQCQTQSAPALSGKITIKTGWRPVLYLVRPNLLGDVATSYTGTVLDSALVSPDGSFAFGHFEPAVEPTLYELCMQSVDSRFPNKRIDDDPETATAVRELLPGETGLPDDCSAREVLDLYRQSAK